jgi:sec-independent protein translocase protein TatA
MDLGAPELIIIAIVVVLLFGAKKLPELAKGAGSALRIFKEEQKALTEDDARSQASAPQPPQEQRRP